MRVRWTEEVVIALGTASAATHGIGPWVAEIHTSEARNRPKQ